MNAITTLLGSWSRIELAHNRVIEWLFAIGLLLVVALATRAIQRIVVGRLARAASATATQVDDVILEVLHGTRIWFHLALGLFAAQYLVELSPKADHVLRLLLVVLLGLQGGVWAQRAAAGAIGLWSAGREGRQDATLAAGLRFIARLVIWTLVILVVMSNLGIQIGAVVAGLGVGGVATALAVQSTLGDLIAGLSLYFDRPFDIGDTITVDTVTGTVEKVGIRSTRVMLVTGEQMVFANGDLAKTRIRNFARMKERRVVLAFGIEYNLPAQKVERARELCEQVVRQREGVRFDRAHFKGFGACSLDFEVVYFITSADYLEYMDHQQAINLALYRALEAEGIPFAFPTQTVHLRQERPA
jgi:small-conductance mechanosensitive channel